ncbi:uncharacterized protein LOC103717439 [Phoenix dactylifera]|uniref:Uncharacterized protein LOC103717439 n=1 Tax=Phoenix dactylifera TaxID=42345 RepID=A0A8B9A6Z4_PHODC|nr:uncharacterized protein LOC103717439 [Phoenix dactylifera]XP_038979647.1 uncharacterized protein LOC103717439 [Phoenix dactylifera]XP_038979648.1 uncharacterized protein LOC103717439 [Phoenix dactylifera]
MAKRSYKRAARSERDKAGCMRGLISMFDFHRGHSSQKLLSDGKHGSGRHFGTRYSKSVPDSCSNSKEKQEIEDDFDEEREETGNLGMPSVKTLMKEEMSRKHSPKKIPSDVAERILSDLDHKVHLERNHKKTSNNQKINSYLHVNDLNAPASLDCHMNLMERSSLNFDLAAVLIEFYGYNNGGQDMHVDCKSINGSSPSLEAIDLWKHYHQDEPDSQIEQKKSILQKALGRVAEAILNQKLVETKQLTGNRAAQAEEFINALEMLNLDKELVLKLLQDPNSLLLKHIQDLQNTQIEKQSKLEPGQNLKGIELLEEEIGSLGQCEESVNNKAFHKQSKHFFRRKDKSKGTGPPEGNVSSQDSNRIVVLKPSPARIQNPSIVISSSSSAQPHHSLNCKEHGQGMTSHFSLKEIKRRLRHVIGENKKDCHLTSIDGVLPKSPNRSKASGDTGKQITNLASKTSRSTADSSQSSAIFKKTDKKIGDKECQLNVESDLAPPRVGSLFYEEAKKHLIEILHIGDHINNLPSRHGSNSLGRILNLPEYASSPGFSPTSNKELDLSPKQTRLSPSRQFKQEDAAIHLNPSGQKSEIAACNASNHFDETQVLESKPELLGTQMQKENCTWEYLNPKETLEIADAKCLEGCNHMVQLSESYSSEPIATGRRFNEEGPDLGSLSEKPQPMTPSVFILPRSSENISEKLDRPSPVSVLEHFFSEDIISPESTTVEQAEVPIQPRELQFEEHDSSSVVLTSSDSEVNRRFCLDDKVARFEYIKTIVEISGLSMDDILKEWSVKDQFLGPSLFDEVGTSYGHLQNNPKLLFDCINEVLMELQERFFRCTPLVSFIKPTVQPVPVGGHFVQEVSKGIDWHLQMQFPCTLSQIVQKDLEGRSWMDLRFETEGICAEIEDTLLDDLTEETVYEFWFEP